MKKDLELFAAMPPLECIKILCSLAVTEGIGVRRHNKEDGMKLEFIDIKKAYYAAPVRKNLYVQLPERDRTDGMCGKLLNAMPGTRDAAQC